jgi:hypothetical protein
MLVIVARVGDCYLKSSISLPISGIYQTKKAALLNVNRLFYSSRPKDGIIELYPQGFALLNRVFAL